MTAKTTKKRKKELSTWGIPLTYVVLTFVVGMLFPRAEHYLLPQLVSTMSAPAAMGICGAVASGMIALTGIVFSLAFVMVQFSATAYSPRLVTAIQVYIDNQLEFTDTTATEVNKLFSMSPGLHFIEVKAWDADGHQVTESRTIDVH